jgi:NO-binding membrane sensor protein with MHYT domain
MHFAWLVVSATTTGFGIWATHFIAMLAYAPGLPTAYHLGFTLLSLVAAVVLTGVGLSLAFQAQHGSEAPWSASASRQCTTWAWRHSKSKVV